MHHVAYPLPSPARRRRPARPPGAGPALLALLALLALAACAPEPPAAPAARSATTPTASVAALAGPAAKVPREDRLAYAVSNRYTSATPWALPGYSSAGGTIVATQLGQGRYFVDFPSLGRIPAPDGSSSSGTEVAIATSVTQGVACSAGHWEWRAADRNLRVYVTCASLATRAFADALFTVMVVGDAALAKPLAFALADRPTAPSYTPRADFSYTSGPGALGVTKLAGIGDWDVRLGTGNPAGAIQLVNAHFGGFACTIAEHKSLGPRVRCFNVEASPRDVPFEVLQVSHGRRGKRFGFAWADQPTSATPYAPNPSYAYNSSGGGVTVTRFGVGAYVVKFLGLQTPTPGAFMIPQVSAFHDGFASCAATGWGDELSPGAEGMTVVVRCTGVYGLPADSRFNVLLIE